MSSISGTDCNDVVANSIDWLSTLNSSMTDSFSSDSNLHADVDRILEEPTALLSLNPKLKLLSPLMVVISEDEISDNP